MGNIVDLASARGQRPHSSDSSVKSDVSKIGPAQIVLYTGIRYERHGPDTTSLQPSPHLS